MANPFVYSKPVAPEDLVGREGELATLLELVEGGHNCRLSAPRRFGKTSLIGRLCADAEREGRSTVYVNFYGILSLADAVARIERGYREIRGPLARWLAGHLATMNATIATPVGGFDRRIRGRRRRAAPLRAPRAASPGVQARWRADAGVLRRVPGDLVAAGSTGRPIRSVIEQHEREAA